MTAAAVAALAACAGTSSTSSPALPGISSPALQHQPQERGRHGKPSTSGCPCLYVANFGNATVTAFASGANGNVAPIATIGGTMTRIEEPAAVTLDAAGNLYVASRLNGSNAGSVTVYPAGSNGNVAPAQFIRGGQTGLDYPDGIAVDPVTGNIYVANYSDNTITIYAPGTTGNVPPLATIAGSSTGLNVCGGLALDASENIYVGNCNNAVNVYAAGSTGNTAPMSVISGRKTHIDDALTLALDATGNVYVGNLYQGGRNYQGSITSYAAGSNGNVAPLAVIKAGKTKLEEPYGLAVDSAGNLYAANANTSTITAYAAGANGNVAPIVKISGGRTTLSEPWGLAIH